LALSVLLLAFGCSDDEDRGSERATERSTERSSLADEGGICLRAADDGALYVRVVANGCFSSSCTTLVEASCEVESVGDTITVHSTLELEQLRGEELLCTADCVPLGAECEFMAIAPGRYVLHLGNSSATIDLPAERLVLFGTDGLTENFCD
jgi:hypothetical protein